MSHRDPSDSPYVKPLGPHVDIGANGRDTPHHHYDTRYSARKRAQAFKAYFEEMDEGGQALFASAAGSNGFYHSFALRRSKAAILRDVSLRFT